VVQLLEQLVSHWPSQSRFHTTLLSSQLPSTSAARLYVSSLGTALRRQNYHSLLSLTRTPVTDTLDDVSDQGSVHTLIPKAIATLLAVIHERARLLAWRALRASYREVNLQTDEQWLAQYLGLGGAGDSVKDWMEKRQVLGDTALKEGSEHKWILKRPSTKS